MIAAAARENNPKRSYLAVNRKQGKHVPVSPKEAFGLYRRLCGEIREVYEGETLLVIGFAETATAIGAFLAAERNALYMQTTREDLPGVSYLYFSESHSHASEQRLVREDLEKTLAIADRILFAEDELTTGNTILSAILAIQQAFGEKTRNLRFSAISVLNGMDDAARRIYEEKQIGLHYLIRSDHGRYAREAAACRADGIYHDAVLTDPQEDIPLTELCISGCMNPRRLVDAAEYRQSCIWLSERIMEAVSLRDGEKILVLGTEECMYPALHLAEMLEEKGYSVKNHATTRSPIVVSSEASYPLHSRYQLASLYDGRRKTFIYDLEPYGCVIVLTDTVSISREGRNSLIHALKSSGSERIYLVRWSE